MHNQEYEKSQLTENVERTEAEENKKITTAQSNSLAKRYSNSQKEGTKSILVAFQDNFGR